MCFGENKNEGGGHWTSNFLSVASTFCQSLCFRGALTTVMFGDSHGELSEKRKDDTCEQVSVIPLTKKLLPKSYFMQGEKGYTFVFFFCFVFYNVLRQHWIPLLSTFTLSFTVIVKYYGPLNNNVAFKKLTNQGDTQPGGLCTFELTTKKKKEREERDFAKLLHKKEEISAMIWDGVGNGDFGKADVLTKINCHNQRPSWEGQNLGMLELTFAILPSSACFFLMIHQGLSILS